MTSLKDGFPFGDKDKIFTNRIVRLRGEGRVLDLTRYQIFNPVETFREIIAKMTVWQQTNKVSPRQVHALNGMCMKLLQTIQLHSDDVLMIVLNKTKNEIKEFQFLSLEYNGGGEKSLHPSGSLRWNGVTFA